MIHLTNLTSLFAPNILSNGILTATQNGTGVRYYYDRLGQLYHVNDPNDHTDSGDGPHCHVI